MPEHYKISIMKVRKKIKGIYSAAALAALALCLILPVSCRKNLLDQTPTTNPSPSTFWKTEADATSGLPGLYASIRPCFDRDYYFDGQAEYFRCRGNSTVAGNAANPPSVNVKAGDAYQ